MNTIKNVTGKMRTNPNCTLWILALHHIASFLLIGFLRDGRVLYCTRNFTILYDYVITLGNHLICSPFFPDLTLSLNVLRFYLGGCVTVAMQIVAYHLKPNKNERK